MGEVAIGGVIAAFIIIFLYQHEATFARLVNGGVFFLLAGAFIWGLVRFFHYMQEREKRKPPPAPPLLTVEAMDALVTEAITATKADHPVMRRYLAALRSYMLVARSPVPNAESTKQLIMSSLRLIMNFIPPSVLNEAPPSQFNEPAASPLLGKSASVDFFDENIYAPEQPPNSHPVILELHIARACLASLAAPVPYRYTQRFEHTWICGTNGSGKTTLLRRLLLHDLDADKPPSLVVIEGEGDLIPWLTKLEHFHPERGIFKDKLYIFSVSQPPPAINIFHRYTEGEAAAEDTLSIFRYLFDRFKIDLSGHQGLLFTPTVRFLFTFPETMGRDANLQDLIDILQVPMPARYREAAERLSQANQEQARLRNFMLGMFNDTMYEDRKKELVGRLIGIQNDGYLGAMLSTEDTGVDLYKILNEGAVIAIDTSGLGDNKTKYGRLCIALVLKAIFARVTIPQQYRKATFLFVDEAQNYFDDKTRELLQNARKFKMGGVFAHQQLADLAEGKLEPYLSGQTSTRLIGRAPSKDWNSLASYVYAPPGATAAQRHDPDFLNDNNREPHSFACWIRDVTKPHGVHISVNASLVDKATANGMDDRAYEELLLNNRERIGTKATPRRPVRATPADMIFVPQPIEPKRKRPKKHRPLVGDIDTSA